MTGRKRTRQESPGAEQGRPRRRTRSTWRTPSPGSSNQPSNEPDTRQPSLSTLLAAPGPGRQLTSQEAAVDPGSAPTFTAFLQGPASNLILGDIYRTVAVPADTGDHSPYLSPGAEGPPSTAPLGFESQPFGPAGHLHPASAPADPSDRLVAPSGQNDPFSPAVLLDYATSSPHPPAIPPPARYQSPPFGYYGYYLAPPSAASPHLQQPAAPVHATSQLAPPRPPTPPAQYQPAALDPHAFAAQAQCQPSSLETNLEQQQLLQEWVQEDSQPHEEPDRWNTAVVPTDSRFDALSDFQLQLAGSAIRSARHVDLDGWSPEDGGDLTHSADSQQRTAAPQATYLRRASSFEVTTGFQPPTPTPLPSNLQRSSRYSHAIDPQAATTTQTTNSSYSLEDFETMAMSNRERRALAREHEQSLASSNGNEGASERVLSSEYVLSDYTQFLDSRSQANPLNLSLPPLPAPAHTEANAATHFSSPARPTQSLTLAQQHLQPLRFPVAAPAGHHSVTHSSRILDRRAQVIEDQGRLMAAITELQRTGQMPTILQAFGPQAYVPAQLSTGYTPPATRATPRFEEGPRARYFAQRPPEDPDNPYVEEQHYRGG